MERSEESRERYTDRGEASDAKRDLLGAVSRVIGFSDKFRRTDGPNFLTGVRDIKMATDDAVGKVQLERLCGRLKEVIEVGDKGSFVAVCEEMYSVAGVGWNELWRKNWTGCLLEFFDGAVAGGGKPAAARLSCRGYGTLVVNFSNGVASAYIEHNDSAL